MSILQDKCEFLVNTYSMALSFLLWQSPNHVFCVPFQLVSWSAHHLVRPLEQ